MQITNAQISTFGKMFCSWFLKMSQSHIELFTFFFYMSLPNSVLRVYFLWERSHRMIDKESAQRKDEEKEKESRTQKTECLVFFCLVTIYQVLPNFMSTCQVQDPQAEFLNLCTTDILAGVILSWGRRTVLWIVGCIPVFYPLDTCGTSSSFQVVTTKKCLQTFPTVPVGWPK